MVDDIVFRDGDADEVKALIIAPLVISTEVGPAVVQKVLVDYGSSFNILFKEFYDQMKLRERDLKPYRSYIHGCIGKATKAIGFVELSMELGEDDHKRLSVVPFLVLDIYSAYNVFLGQPALAEFRVAVDLRCLTMKFPTNNGVGIVHGDQVASRECYIAKLKEAKCKEEGKSVEGILCIRLRIHSNYCSGPDSGKLLGSTMPWIDEKS